MLAYIGPGAGFAFLGSFLTILLSLFTSLLSILIWPFRLLWLAIRRRGRFANTQVDRAIFLGLDGLDPNLTERWMAEGKLPNLARLAGQGTYRRLRTTFPALSPVAWSTFATGVNPGRHNIFDFLNRDLRTYAPELSSARVRASEKGRAVVEMRRKSQPFWAILGRNAIPSTILRVPITFPPEPFKGHLLSAMSTPDLRGTQGTFSLFSTRANARTCEGGVMLPLTRNGDVVQGSLAGPEGLTTGFTVDSQHILRIGGEEYELKTGEYTPWIRIRFRKSRFRSIRGIVRFLLTETVPEISIYATPVEIDPENPALPISYPNTYAIYLAKLLGSFATLGMAEDTWALNEGAIDEPAFLAQAKLIQQERESMFFNALDRSKRGVIACVFDTTDRVQHMFYRYIDPHREPQPDSPFANTIEDLYRDMDRVVGRTLSYADEKTAVFVLSDHGFSSFRRGVNLNSWLHQNGYLALLPGLTESGDYFDGIDWRRTRAYTFGLSGIYLNIEGREAQGIVAPEDAPALRRELIEKLRGLTDESQPAIHNVYDAREIYNGPYTSAAPDLIIGYAPSYRAAWSAAVGKVTGSVLEANNKCWSGDHCIDPSEVPGVLFCNRKLDTGDHPGIEDMAPTALKLFGIDAPAWMEGRALTLKTT